VAAGPAAASAAADSRRARRAAGHESAGECRRLLAVLVERGLKPRESPVTLRPADRVDGQVVWLREYAPMEATDGALRRDAHQGLGRVP
jgi:hypothetical protein